MDAPSPTPGTSTIRNLVLSGLGLAVTVASLCPGAKGILLHGAYLRKYGDDPRTTHRLPAIEDDTIMRNHKIKVTGKREKEQRLAKKDLEAERQYYRRLHSRDRAITQEIPVMPMYDLVQGRR
jgi:hypothetical protein